ncbi:M48 family metalloprotease [Pikeienuella sp. HZG-20]|uniref:M48 family metalloprotease n=1 Tax=Paludibacillus litoralis TaxID=3133267 RepID=UPI0030EF719B
MRRPPLARSLAALLAALAVAACAAPGGPPSDAPQTVAARSAGDQRTGDQNHPKILAQFGGEVADRQLRAYVNRIGQRIAAETEQPNARWTFTVLDSAVVNAFALPGGYVYVTRGLVALANDEAELAGVIGHEIGHVTAAHSSQRQQQAGLAQLGVLGATLLGAAAGLTGDALGAVSQLGSQLGQGYVASYSRTQEFEADRLGVRYLARAGYDPKAEADFLANLQAETELQARIAGGAYNPNRVDFFATHPATAERVRVAAGAASVEAAGAEGSRNRDAFLAAIDGMVYGDSPAQGFVDGRRFSHPELRFTFTAPEGFRIQNSAAKVTIVGPQGAGIIFDGDSYAGGSMDAYIARIWAPAIARQGRVGALQNLQRTRIGGLEAASALLPVQTNQGVKVLRMTAIRDGDAVWRFLGVQPQGAARLGQEMDGAAASFAKLSAAEAARLKPKVITIHTVRAGETVEALAARTPFREQAAARFRVLNGLGPREEPRPGRKVKLVRG